MNRCLRLFALLLLAAGGGVRAQPALAATTTASSAAAVSPASAESDINSQASNSAHAIAKALVEDSRKAVRNDPEKSRVLAERALAELAKYPDANLEVAAHWVLCDYHAERDRNAAQRHLKSAQALLSRTTQPSLAAQLLGCEGALSELGGDSANAMVLYERAVSLAQDAHDEEIFANALYERGYLRGVRGELANGLADLRRSNDIYERIHLPEQALNTLLAVATMYDRMGDHL